MTQGNARKGACISICVHAHRLPRWLSGKELACQFRRQGLDLAQEDPLEKKMATHSSILDWKIPWIEGTGMLQFIGLQTGRHDWAPEHTYAVPHDNT